MDPATVKEYNKKYYENHKNQYLGSGKYNCKKMCETCNREYSKLNFSKHLKTSKHIKKTQSI